MRQVKLEVLDPESIKELASGGRLQLIIDNTTVAEIIPTNADALIQRQEENRERRRISRERLFAMMEKGFDLGGLKITNRDELYDRSSAD